MTKTAWVIYIIIGIVLLCGAGNALYKGYLNIKHDQARGEFYHQQLPD